ncbi:MAG: hypothetical protein P4L22_00235 [Candidatus Babeliales bacterium]|nr:hypothetical protein [Candidatus Babeliales bacterium]
MKIKTKAKILILLLTFNINIFGMQPFKQALIAAKSKLHPHVLKTLTSKLFLRQFSSYNKKITKIEYVKILNDIPQRQYLNSDNNFKLTYFDLLKKINHFSRQNNYKKNRFWLKHLLRFYPKSTIFNEDGSNTELAKYALYHAISTYDSEMIIQLTQMGVSLDSSIVTYEIDTDCFDNIRYVKKEIILRDHLKKEFGKTDSDLNDDDELLDILIMKQNYDNIKQLFETDPVYGDYYDSRTYDPESNGDLDGEDDSYGDGGE